jgi:uncharacterized membrane protein YccF (DUF307 family)
MRLLGNLIWLVFGGILIAVEYLAASLLLMLTIIGIPFGLQTLKLASLALWPFGRNTIYIERPAGCLTTLMNILWIILGGIWISISHVLFGFFFFLTIIGIPFGLQHFKLASIALAPFGRRVVSVN